MTLTDIMSPTIEDQVEDQVVEQENEGVEAASTVESPTGDQVEDDNPFVNRIESLYADGSLGIDELPEEFKGREFNAETTIDLLEYALKNKGVTEIEKERENIFNEIMGSMSELTKKAYEYELKNNDPDDLKDFYRGLVFEQDIKALDPEKNAEEIIKEYHKALKTPKAEVDELIDDLKQLNKLTDKAKALKPKLDEKVAEIATKKLEDQKAFEQREREALKWVDKNLDKVITDGVGIKITKEMETFLKGVLVHDEILVEHRGKEIPVSGAEWLIRHHKFSKDGNLPHLVKTLLFLQYPEEFEKQYEKKAIQKETQKFIKDHKVSGGVKSGLFSNDDVAAPPKKGGLILGK